MQILLINLEAEMYAFVENAEMCIELPKEEEKILTGSEKSYSYAKEVEV